MCMCNIVYVHVHVHVYTLTSNVGRRVWDGGQVHTNLLGQLPLARPYQALGEVVKIVTPLFGHVNEQ